MICVNILRKQRMNLNILKTDANLAIGAIWANHSDSTEILVIGSLDKLEDLSIAREKDIALCEFCFICLCHIIIK